MTLAREIAAELVKAHADVLLGEPACAHFRDKDFAMDGLSKVIQEVLERDARRTSTGRWLAWPPPEDPTPKPMANPWVSHGQPTVQPMAEPTEQPTPKPPPAPCDCDA